MTFFYLFFHSKVFPLLASFKFFSLSLFFCGLHICQSVDFLVFIPLAVIWAPWVCGLVSVINFGNSWSLLLQIFLQLCSFFSCGITIIHILHILKLCMILGALFSVFLFAFNFNFTLHFSLRSFYRPSSLLILSLAMFSLLMSPTKEICICLNLFLISRLPFHFFLELLSLSLYYSSVLACCILFSFSAFNIVIITLKFSDHSKICVTSEFTSYIYFFSLH